LAVHLKKRAAQGEAAYALKSHLDILADVRKWCLTENEGKEKFYYLLALPIVYSAWEGFFRVSCAICLRRNCVLGNKAKSYRAAYSTLWLQKESFLESFFRTLFNSMSLGKDNRKINAGRFHSLTDFVSDLNAWLDNPLDHAQDFDKLVMTYSNVNEDIARLNCGIIGIDVTGIDFSKLNEVVGRRNDVAHGGLIAYPDEAKIVELVVYTENLLKQFPGRIVAWLQAT
jgi:hypothetical protein